MKILLWILLLISVGMTFVFVPASIFAVIEWSRLPAYLCFVGLASVLISVLTGAVIKLLAILDRVVPEPGAGTKQESSSSPPKASVDSEKLIEKEMKRARRQSGELNPSSPWHPDYKPTPKP